MKALRLRKGVTNEFLEMESSSPSVGICCTKQNFPEKKSNETSAVAYGEWVPEWLCGSVALVPPGHMMDKAVSRTPLWRVHSVFFSTKCYGVHVFARSGNA